MFDKSLFALIILMSECEQKHTGVVNVSMPHVPL